MSSSERAGRVRELFGRARELEEDAREAWLAEATAGDRELYDEVRALLAYDARSPALLGSRVQPRWPWLRALVDGDSVELPEVTASPAAALDDEAPPASIGAFRILSTLGRGGMGVVYLAREEQPPRLVALKVMRPELVSPRLLRRFEFEASVLARLEHPAIGHIYAAGTAETPSGPRPYFALELVEGAPITDWAAEQRLSLRERVALFIRLCEGVQHAHQKGVLHRDLKPANVLVDGAGLPRILDFGVARLLEREVTDESSLTRPGQLLGTLAYMSPEQCSGPAAEVDTRSDVYALGVILYELLAGQRPYEVEGLALLVAARVVSDAIPVALGRHDRALRGDLETITAKALEKAPARRYASAQELAADLARWLREEPIVARPPSTFYILGKLVRRHRPLVAGLSLAAAALLVALVLVTAKNRQVQAAESRAVASFAAADGLLETIVNDWLGSKHLFGRGAADFDLAHRVMDQAASLWRDEPDRQAALHHNLATAFDEAGDFDVAQELYLSALTIRSSLFGGWGEPTLQTAGNYGNLLQERGRYREAEKWLHSALDGWVQLHGKEALVTLEARNDLALLLADRGEIEQALSEFEFVHTMRLQLLCADDVLTNEAKINLADLLATVGQLDRAEALAEAALDSLNALEPEVGRMEALRASRVLGNIEITREQSSPAALNNALKHLESAFFAQGQLLGVRHPETLNTAISLGVAKSHMGELEEAGKLFASAFQSYFERDGIEHPVALVALNNLAEINFRLEDYIAARAQFEVVLRQRRQTLTDLSPELISSLVNLAATSTKLELYAEAQALLSEALASRYCRSEPLGFYSLYARNNLVEVGILQGNYASARAAAEELVAYAEVQGDTAGEMYAAFRRNLGIIQHRLGESAAALRSLELCSPWYFEPSRYGTQDSHDLLELLHEAARSAGDQDRETEYGSRLETWPELPAKDSAGDTSNDR